MQKLRLISEMEIFDERQNYARASFDESDADLSPFIQFEKWFSEAKKGGIREPNAMVLATATAAGKPSARIVLLKEFSGEGFVFFTNYDSRKGHEMLENPQGQLLFFWNELERQVRIEGVIEKISAARSEAYFNSRPLNSRYGAMISNQSEVIDSRKTLEEELEKLQQNPPKRPAHWGGYILKPTYFEFWQGRPSRLHDRIAYLGNESWRKVRLAP